MNLQNGGHLSRARRFGAACEPLTNGLLSENWNPREGGRGSQGVVHPLAEYEAAPHARPRARWLPDCIRARSPAIHVFGFPILPVGKVDSRLVATLPSALSRQLAAAVPIGVLNSKGRCYLNVDLREPQVPSIRSQARSRPNSALPFLSPEANLLRCLACYLRTLVFLGLAVVVRIVDFSRHP